MADISLSGVSQQLERRFKQQGNGLRRFAQDAVDAVNHGIRAINRGANLETRLSTVVSLDGTTVTGLHSDYTDILVDIATLNLIEQGQRPSKGYEQDVIRLRVSMEYRIDDIRTDILNQAIDADTDNESDFVALGGVGA